MASKPTQGMTNPARYEIDWRPCLLFFTSVSCGRLAIFLGHVSGTTEHARQMVPALFNLAPGDVPYIHLP